MDASQTPANRPSPATRWLPPAASALCFLFGLMLLAIVLVPADGYWQLHADLMRQGQRLYSDLGLNQQPFFFLLSSLSLQLFSDTIYGQRVLAVLLLAVYVHLLHRIAHATEERTLNAVILQVAVFFTAIRDPFFRFDDYHVVAHVGVLASVALSISYLRGRQPLGRYAVLQVALATFVFLTRINEGAAIVAAVGLLVLLKEGFQVRLLRLFGVGSAVTGAILVAVLFLIGETPATWLRSTLVEASAAKGGASLLSYPYVLLRESAAAAAEPTLAPLPVIALPVLLGAAAAWRLRRTPLLANGIVAATFLYAIAVLQRGYGTGAFAMLSPFVVIGLAAIISAGLALTAVRKAKGTDEGPRGWWLLFYPFFLYIFGSLSTGGKVDPMAGVAFPLAVAVLLTPSAILERLGPAFKGGARIGFYLLCVLLAVGGAKFRYQVPYLWLNLHAGPPGRGYGFREDSPRGAHFISDELAALMDPVCARVGDDDTLLSTPLSFANYYCGVPTWRGYVQTWYDLSTEVKIDRLLADLRREPPDYLFYQQQDRILRHHEKVFNGGRPLPYRKLEAYMRERVTRGEWRVVHASDRYPDSRWLLLRTARPPAAAGRVARLVFPGASELGCTGERR